jgi:hypothetical protein
MQNAESNAVIDRRKATHPEANAEQHKEDRFHPGILPDGLHRLPTISSSSALICRPSAQPNLSK